MSHGSSVNVRVANAAGGRVQVALAAMLWGTSGIAGRVAGAAGSSPAVTAAARTIVAAVVLLVLVACVEVPPLPRRRGARLGVGAIGVLLAVYQTAYFAAVAQAGVTVATLIALGVAPVLVALAAPLVGDPAAGPRTWSAVAVACAGLALLVAGAGSAVPAGGDVLRGALLALVCAAGFAGVNLLGRTLTDVAPLRLIAVAFGVGGLLQVPALIGGVGDVDASGLLVLAYLGLIPTALAYLLFFRGIAVVGAAVAAVTALLEPATAAALAVVLVGEHVAATGWVGVGLVLAAMFLIGSANDRPSQRARALTRWGSGSGSRRWGSRSTRAR